MVRYSCLIVGLGNIGMNYDFKLEEEFVLSHARAASNHPNFLLIGAVDPNPENVKRFTDRFKLSAYLSLKDALKEKAPDVIVVATPTPTHHDILVECLEQSNPIAVLIEKPLEIDFRKAKLSVEACEKKNVGLFVNYMRLADPGVLAILDKLSDGSIARPLKGVVWYSKGVLNTASHYLNLLEFWLGPCLQTQLLSTKKKLTHRDDYDCDFIARFDGADIYFCSTSDETESYHSLEIISQSGRLTYERGGEEIWWQAIERSKIRPDVFEISRSKSRIKSEMFKYQYNVFDMLSKQLQGQSTTICTGNQALVTIRNIMNVIGDEYG